ncbi:MAG: Type 1 glutamine amidotransferase-like domain-containing protein [Bacteroidaceae bacterium]
MTLFLTSSPFVEDSPLFSEENDFARMLLHDLPKPVKALFVASNPADVKGTEQWAQCMKESLGELGANVLTANALHDETALDTPYLVSGANFIMLCGGHVPTQNHFFQKIGLRSLLSAWQGVLLGVSAGSMNSAERVYALPEEEGESVDPFYQRFLPGLGLTQTCIIPHFQRLRDMMLDGKMMIDEIAVGDSMGHRFYALPDGSFVYKKGTREELHGPAWFISDGVCRLCNHSDEILLLSE